MKKLEDRIEESVKNLLKEMTRMLKIDLRARGFIVPADAEFYVVGKTGRVGMKVGGYTHSCHVETTDIVVLFFANSNLGDAEAFDGYMEATKIEL